MSLIELRREYVGVCSIGYFVCNLHSVCYPLSREVDHSLQLRMVSEGEHSRTLVREHLRNLWICGNMAIPDKALSLQGVWEYEETP